MTAIFDFMYTQAPDSLRSSLVVLFDPENTGIAVGISSLSCIGAELYVISHLLLVNGRHLWLPAYSGIRQFPR